MRPITWVLSIILALLLIVAFVAPRFIPKKEVVTTSPEQPPSPEEEAVSVQIPQKQEYNIPGAALRDISAAVGSDAIETRLPEVDPAMLEAPLQAPALSPEENMAKALKRVEAAKFFEKMKEARDNTGRVDRIKGAVFSSKGMLFNEKEK